MTLIAIKSEIFRKIAVRKVKFQVILFIVSVVTFDIFVMRNILFIGGFQSADIDVAWIGLHGVHELFFPWNFENLGGASFPAGNFFISAYTSIVLGPALAEKVIYYTSVPAASLFALLFLREMNVNPRFSFILSFMYQLNPWFVDEFMTGEPGFTWMFTFLPLVAYFLLRSFKFPRKLSNYFCISIILAIAEMYTLQSLIVYAFLLAPFLFSMLSTKHYKARVISIIGIFLSTVLSLLANIYSLGSYFRNAAELVSSSSVSTRSLFGGFSSPQAQSLKPWIILLLAGSLLSTILVYRKARTNEKVFLVSTIIFQAFFLIVYFSIPSHWVALIYLKFPAFTPFQNPDKFLLVPTIFTFSIIVLMINGNDLRRNPLKDNQKHEVTSFPYNSKLKLKLSVRNIVIIFITLLLTSSFSVASIHPSSSHINGDYYLHGEFSFPQNQIPSQYYALRSYLLNHGENFSLSSHVLVVPQNPGNVLPFYVGETIIPGFIGPTQDMYTIINDISHNQSLATYAMALLGIKYVAILGDQGDSGWSGANGHVSEGVWAGGYFPQGNISYYTKTLESWPSLKQVYNSDNLTILLNTNFVGRTYFINQGQDPYSGNVLGNLTVTQMITNVTLGNYLQLYNNIRIGNNTISNPNVQNYSYWHFNTISGNSSLLRNGTVVLKPGSKGASLTQNVILMPNTTYELSLCIQTNPGYSGFPPTGYERNFAGIYWNNGTGFNGTAGASINGYFNGNFTGHRYFVFSTPQYNGTINAEFVLSYEPPVGNQTIYTTYKQISLLPINGSNIFHSIVKPFPLSSVSSSRYNAVENFTSKGGYVVLDTLYSPEWVASTNNGSLIQPTPGPFGLLEFHIGNGTTLKSIYFTGASNHSLEIYVGWIVFGILASGFVVTMVLERWRVRT